MDEFINCNENKIDHVDTSVCVIAGKLWEAAPALYRHTPSSDPCPLQTTSIQFLEVIYLYGASTDPDLYSNPLLLVVQDYDICC